ncbi:hypothetical protein [Rhizobium lentis]|uniref:Uncharacterized protein n=1 Tax=Rhizobium lentis TaxID=1138194 RepID=A0A7W8XCJ6_9HYPH|nr:hypothetical protein [Rhizobium lentis]MBB4572841.1 hypothetical protein [Rhizobium lentis]MBB5547970.1 hypothetical protein [Rhizobium lentis]MBB5558497.1 hypothetical protein [Rhizobium lentis]MBB5565979.1 hypothetical protein [Rhizobium lentis]
MTQVSPAARHGAKLLASQYRAHSFTSIYDRVVRHHHKASRNPSEIGIGHRMGKSMPNMPAISAVRLHVQIVLVLMLCFPGMAAATPPCRDNTLAKAKVVVEARVKSLSIGDPGLLLPKDYPNRVIRVDLEIEKVIKGTFIGKEATFYGITYPPPERLLELLIMSLAIGPGGRDTFEWELSANKIDDDMSFYSLNNCHYSKFPIDILPWQRP